MMKFICNPALLPDKDKAKLQDDYMKISEILYWVNLVIAGLYVVVFVWGFELGAGGYKEEYVRGDTRVSHPAFFVHCIAGSVYYITGYIQFNPSLRRNYPKVHKLCGMIYIWMAYFLLLGIIIVICSGAIAPWSSGFWVSVMLPYLGYLHYDSLKAIWRRDIDRHRRMQIRSFVASNMIIWQRVPTFVLWLSFGVSINVSLAIAFWWVTAIAVGGCEIYLWLDYHLRPPPIVYLKDGTKFFSSEDTQPAMAMNPCEIIIHECKLSPDKKSLILVFQSADNDGTMSFLFPGQHVSLLHPSVPDSVREYSPIITEEDAKAGRIRLWIRLVPNGVMSSILTRLVNENNENANPMSNPNTNEGNAKRTTLLFSVASGRFPYFPNNYQGMLMICTGTGIAPISTLVNYILNNPADKTNVQLVYITNATSSTDDYGLEVLEDLQRLQKGNKRLSVVTQKSQPRMDYLMIGKLVQEGVEQNFYGTDVKGVQIHLSGNPLFVKSLYLSLLDSRMMNLKPEQVVGWGYSDR